jgi:hypothetical protein
LCGRNPEPLMSIVQDNVRFTPESGHPSAQRMEAC